MRSAVFAVVAVVGLAALPSLAQASPAMPHEFGVAKSALVEVRGGCGPGWHPQGWRDRWGRWVRRCVPNRW